MKQRDNYFQTKLYEHVNLGETVSVIYGGRKQKVTILAMLPAAKILVVTPGADVPFLLDADTEIVLPK